ncbi:hypothetical protein Q8A67_005368 [Cirrhinus molitorella]|uniref:Uncharacterized protein n=1 Tax=Cirrhinus molitorella TaxID=172907 RepID=A0AA88PZM0_9TELE|nr:hypothetical protein Q8A67_005368 [Cirrhinus molitorella]
MEEPEALRSDWLLQPMSSYQPITAGKRKLSAVERLPPLCRVAEQQQRRGGKNESQTTEETLTGHPEEAGRQQRSNERERKRGASLMNPRSVTRHLVTSLSFVDSTSIDSLVISVVVVKAVSVGFVV